MANTFSIKESLSVGWNLMKRNFLLFFYVLLTLLGLQVLVNISEHTDPGLVIAVVVIVISMMLKLGLIRITLDLVDGKRANYKQLFSQPNLFPDYLIATILYFLIVIGGLILLIIPGIIWGLRYSLFEYYIVDKKMKPMDALRASAKATHGHKWTLLWFYLTLIGVNILGFLALIVGLFATIPTSEVAGAWVYRRLDAGTAVKRRAKKKR